jgi:small-conductance mechanosensitive channel
MLAWAVRRGPLRFQAQELFSGEDLGKIVGGLAKAFRVLVKAFIIFAYLNIVMSFFEITRGLVSSIVSYVGSVLYSLGHSIVVYLPNLAVVVVVLFIIKYLMRLLGLVFHGLGSGRISVDGFYSEWAQPTFNILRVIVFAFTLVIIFPYLPGSGSPAFQGVSLFMGLLLSLGSTAAISNVVAGIVITYTRAFRIGDRVRIASAEGTVLEKTLFVTRLSTVKNEEIAIPNSMVMANHIINYSAQAETSGVLLHTTVTIGYDIPWRDVHGLLINAARNIDTIEEEPEPFVLQKSLNDFYVCYELNATTRHPKKAAVITSRLHQQIQDLFAEAKIEIMSPHFAAVRDGAASSLPPEHLPPDYQPTPFQVLGLEKVAGKQAK